MRLPRLPFGLDGYVAIGAAIVMALALSATVWMIRESGKTAKAKELAPVIAGLNRDLGACKTTLAQQADALKTQNAAIDRLAEEREELARAADAAIRKAQQEARAYQRRAERIAKARPGPDVCASARSLIVETLEGER